MNGSFNRLLAQASKRRLQRRGEAWQEGDFSFADVSEKKINEKEGTSGNFDLVYFGIP